MRNLRGAAAVMSMRFSSTATGKLGRQRIVKLTKPEDLPVQGNPLINSRSMNCAYTSSVSPHIHLLMHTAIGWVVCFFFYPGFAWVMPS